MGYYEKPGGTRRWVPVVPGAMADNGDYPCFGKRLLQVLKAKLNNPVGHNGLRSALCVARQWFQRLIFARAK